MMMVDTINPNTNEPDQLPGADNNPAVDTQMSQNTVPSQEDRFYGGFDKPDNVKVNLASTEPGMRPQAVSDYGETVPVESQTKANNIDNMAPKAPVTESETQLHTAYSKKTPVNVRGLVVIVAIGLVATLIFTLGTYFILSVSNNSKITDQQAVLDELNSKLSVLSETPDALSVPIEVTEKANAEAENNQAETVVTPVVPDTTDNIESVETDLPSKTSENTAEAAG